MDLKEEGFESKFDEGGEVDAGESLGETGSVSEIRVESNGELDHGEEVSLINSPVGAGVGDRAGEGRGSASPAEAVISSHGHQKENGDSVGGGILADSFPSPAGSPVLVACADAAKPLSSAAPKGYGLKKWRRIRRDTNREGTPGAEATAIHKRSLSIEEPPKGREETKNRSDSEVEGEGEGSVASMESRNVVDTTPIMISPSRPIDLDSELGLLTANGFAIGVDSDNSEDRSSKSSTAASAPRLRHETGFGRDRSSRIRNLGGRGSGHVVQHKGQRPKGGTEAGRKARGNPVKVEKENSYSSVESNMRSTNPAFAQWGSVVSNGKKSETSVNYDEEHSDDAQPSEEVQSGYGHENGKVEDLSRENLIADLLDEENINKSENSQADSYADPLLESIFSLQAAQDALENEIQIFMEIGKETTIDDFDDHLEEKEGSSSPVPEARAVELNKKIDQLEHKLEEASVALKVKDSKLAELEAILSEMQQKQFANENLSVLQQSCKQLEVEFESLLKKKIETETEFIIISRATQNWKILQEDHNALLEESKKDLVPGLRNAEIKANMIEAQSEEISKRLLETQEISRLQTEVCKYSFCSFVQVVMLCVALGLCLIRLLPSSTEFVPT